MKTGASKIIEARLADQMILPYHEIEHEQEDIVIDEEYELNDSFKKALLKQN